MLHADLCYEHLALLLSPSWGGSLPPQMAHSWGNSVWGNVWPL